jgi:hypothetical protein
MFILFLDQQGPELYDGPPREPKEDQEAIESQRAVGAIPAVVEEGALVKVPDASSFTAAARSTVMENLDLR